MCKSRAAWLVVAVLGAGVLTSGCATPEAAPSEEEVGVEGAAVAEGEMLIVPQVGVGEVKFGMTLDEVKQVWGEPEGPRRGQMYNYFSKGVQLVTLGQSRVVTQIFCLSPVEGAPESIGPWEDFKGRTAEGIGMGSTEAEVVSAYGEPTKRESAGGGFTTLLYDENMPKALFFVLYGGSVVEICLVDGTQLRGK